MCSSDLGQGRATFRHDRFRTAGRDILPADANDELGHAWAIAYSVPLQKRFTLVVEVLRVASNRSARGLIGAAPHLVENSLGVELRRTF